MATGFRNSSGVDFDSLFDPYVQGTPPSDTGFRLSSGVDLAGRYAPISFGSKGPDVGFRTSSGTDVSNLWAAYGTASYSLPINGRSYTRSRGRGTASLSFNMKSDGTYSITNDLGTVLDSGTWLPSGDSVSSYTCVYSTTMSSGPDPGGGNRTISNDAPTQASLTTSRTFTGAAGATVTGTTASNNGSVTMDLYKSGVLKSSTVVTFNCDASGS